MKTTFRILMIMVVVLMVGSSVFAQEDRTGWPEIFIMGIFGGDDAAEALNSAEALRAYMEAQLGIPVQVFAGTSYSAVITAMRYQRVDAMEVGPFAYILAHDEANAEPLAVGLPEGRNATEFDPNAYPYYFSVLITRKGSGIRTIEDLAGHSFAFVDPASTSGHNAPRALIMKTLGFEEAAQVDEFMQTTFAGSHPSAVLAVMNGSADAGATYEGNLVNLRTEGQAEVCGYENDATGIILTQEEIDAIYDACEDGKLVVIAQSDPIPTTPFAVRADLPESFKTAVRDALLAIKDDPALITEFGFWYVDPTESLGLENLDAFYNSVRDIRRLSMGE